MDHFEYKKGELYAENIAISEIAKKVGTPFYCYSSATLTHHYKVFSDAFKSIPTLICFAVKANSNVAVLKTLAKLGSGADTVSEGEIRRARKAGIPAKKIVFSGVGKTKKEMRYALKEGVGQFNVESKEELFALNDVAKSLKKKAPVAIRVNPDVDAGSHDKISTGRKTDKFGVEWDNVLDLYEKAKDLKNIKIIGVTTHIGSQLTELTPFKKAFDKIVGLVEALRRQGHEIKKLDLGGGLGIPYKDGGKTPPHPQEYAKMIVEMIKHLKCELVLEPGRLIAGNAGILVSEVVFLKDTPARKFLVIDAAMNDLMRPSLYDAFHEIIPVLEPEKQVAQEVVDVVGPVCETTDVFGRNRMIPILNSSDLIAIRSSGAYGAVMSNTYNSRPLIAEVMVKGKEFAVIRKRQTYSQLLNLDKIPSWV